VRRRSKRAEAGARPQQACGGAASVRRRALARSRACGVCCIALSAASASSAVSLCIAQRVSTRSIAGLPRRSNTRAAPAGDSGRRGLPYECVNSVY